MQKAIISIVIGLMIGAGLFGLGYWQGQKSVPISTPIIVSTSDTISYKIIDSLNREVDSLRARPNKVTYKSYPIYIKDSVKVVLKLKKYYSLDTITANRDTLHIGAFADSLSEFDWSLRSAPDSIQVIKIRDSVRIPNPVLATKPIRIMPSISVVVMPDGKVAYGPGISITFDFKAIWKSINPF